MQPTFAGWLGYFRLISLVDHFIVYDNSNLSYQSWQHRNLFLINNKPQLITIPIASDSKFKSINAACISSSFNVAKILRSFDHSYGKFIAYKSIRDDIHEIFIAANQHLSLIKLNLQLIEFIMSYLSINSTKISLSSSLLKRDHSRTDYIYEIGRSLSCDQYLTPPGAVEYLKSDNFSIFCGSIDSFVLSFTPPKSENIFPLEGRSFSALDYIFRLCKDEAQDIFWNSPFELVRLS